MRVLPCVEQLETFFARNVHVAACDVALRRIGGASASRAASTAIAAGVVSTAASNRDSVPVAFRSVSVEIKRWLLLTSQNIADFNGACVFMNPVPSPKCDCAAVIVLVLCDRNV